ncbi:uncharacterized protein LOC141798295 [Halichoeres trimaculatus]|uniref:uncharacterized protein LOC141798295 n=1 Tax=Halichoeres trimaculatus TaxID=147232 RepID=UPI003D9E98F6
MAARWSLEDFLKYLLFFFFFLLALEIGSVYVTEGTSQEELQGKVGGSVIFRCPVEPNKSLKMLYLQRDLSFVNGFYASRNISQKWQNTQMDEKNMIVTMHSLNVSHEGTYQCIIEYYNDPISHKTSIHLKVTGDYSEPKLMVLHQDEISWTVMCSSHGGYPSSSSSEIAWNPNGSRKVLNSTEVRDPVTLTFNSSSTAVFNCTKDEKQFINCTIGGVTSTQLPICTSKPPDPLGSTVFIVAIVVSIIIFVIGVSVLVKTRRKCRNSEGAEVEAPEAVRPETENSHTVEEETALTRGEDAP